MRSLACHNPGWAASVKPSLLRYAFPAWRGSTFGGGLSELVRQPAASVRCSALSLTSERCIAWAQRASAHVCIRAHTSIAADDWFDGNKVLRPFRQAGHPLHRAIQMKPRIMIASLHCKPSRHLTGHGKQHLDMFIDFLGLLAVPCMWYCLPAVDARQVGSAKPSSSRTRRCPRAGRARARLVGRDIIS